MQAAEPQNKRQRVLCGIQCRVLCIASKIALGTFAGGGSASNATTSAQVDTIHVVGCLTRWLVTGAAPTNLISQTRPSAVGRGC